MVVRFSVGLSWPEGSSTLYIDYGWWIPKKGKFQQCNKVRPKKNCDVNIRFAPRMSVCYIHIISTTVNHMRCHWHSCGFTGDFRCTLDGISSSERCPSSTPNILVQRSSPNSVMSTPQTLWLGGGTILIVADELTSCGGNPNLYIYVYIYIYMYIYIYIYIYMYTYIYIYGRLIRWPVKLWHSFVSKYHLQISPKV